MAYDRLRALSALQTLDPGTNRETWLRIAMAAKDAGLTIDDFTEWSRPAPNFGGERECGTLWRSIKDGSVTAATLYSMAYSMGWKDPGRTRYNRHARPLAAPTRHEDTLAQERPQSAAIFSESDATALWEKWNPATAEHPYILAKGGNPDGLRIVPNDNDLRIAGQSVAGWLAVPACSLNGVLRTVQLIPPPGESRKLNLPGQTFEDGLFIVGNVSDAARIFIAEGIGQAWACWRAAGNASAVTFGAGRMDTVATVLRAKYPAKPLILVPDRGKESGAEIVARKVRGRLVKLPNDKPSNYDVNDYAAEHGPEALAELLEHKDSPAFRYRVKGAAEVLDAPPLRWMVRGVLPAEGLACIFGASGSGKSFLALDLCAAIASGQMWFCRKVKAAPVVYVALEGEAGFSQRVKAWQVHHGAALPAMLRFVMQSFDLRNAEDVEALAVAVIASGGAGGLLVIDTLNRAASGADENTSRDMGEIIDAAKSLQAHFGGLVLLVHHSGKDQSRGLRGHSSLNAALDASIEVVNLDNRRQWRIDKSKDGTDDAGQAFRLQSVEIGRHDDGEPITSCVVAAEDGERQWTRRTLPPKSGTQKVVLDALGEVLRCEGNPSPPDAPASLPRGRPALPVEHAIAQIRGHLACDPKRRTERTQQAMTALQARGLIAIDGGLVWMP